MKGNGNGISTLIQKLIFYMLPTSGQRSRYIKKHRSMFRHIGDKLFWQPRKFPSDPEKISIGNNVKIASDVIFINHDVIGTMLNDKYDSNDYKNWDGDITVGNNVMIGYGTIIMGGVTIGDDVIIAAGSIVTKDIPSGNVVAGSPARVIGSFDEIAKKHLV